MRIYRIGDSGEFTEFEERSFSAEHREETMEAWLEGSPDAIVEDGSLLLIGRQVTTDLGGSIDLLALDREGNVAVVELKRDRTPRDTLAQALEYASFAEQLGYDQIEGLYQSYSGEEGSSLAEAHRTYFGLDESEAVSFNKDQRIVVVGSEIVPSVRQTALYLRHKGLRVTCLEFRYFRTEAGERLLSTDIAVGREPARGRTVTTDALPKTDMTKFLAQCDDAGRRVFEPILALANTEGYPIHWGSRGLSVNVILDGRHVNICAGYPKPQRRQQTVQSLWSTVWAVRKLEGSEELVATSADKLRATGLFVPGGREVKYLITHEPTVEQIEAVVRLLRDLAEAVKALSTVAELTG